MFLGPAAWLLARAVGAKFIWDVRDLTWRYASESIQLSNLEKRAARTLEQWMNFVASQADLVIVATNGIAELLVETGIRQSRILTVPNGVSKAVLEQFVEEASPRKARPLVAYIGLLGYNQAVGVLLDVAKRVPEADFLIVGDGPERIALLKRAKHDNVSNLELHPYVTDRDEIISLYRKADVLVHHTLDTPTLNRTSNPSKLYEYMAARRPIVYGGKGLAADVISASGGGLVVPPQDPDSMALAIRSLLEDPKGRLKMARDGRSFVERHHCRETLMECILEAVGRVLRETV